MIPLRPQPTVTSDPPASRRATLILNVAFVAVAAVIVLSNLLFFPLGPGATRHAAKPPPERAPPEASAPVIVDLPAPKPPDAEPAPESGTGEEDASALPRIEPAAPPPPDVVASLPPATESVSAAPVTPPAPPTETPAANAAAPALPAGEVEALTRRGHALLVTGDIIAARFAYERAARAGSATAATGVGKTYDPLFLASAGVRGIQGNPFEAAAWYRRGSAAGDLEAEVRLEALRQQFPE